MPWKMPEPFDNFYTLKFLWFTSIVAEVVVVMVIVIVMVIILALEILAVAEEILNKLTLHPFICINNIWGAAYISKMKLSCNVKEDIELTEGQYIQATTFNHTACLQFLIRVTVLRWVLRGLLS